MKVGSLFSGAGGIDLGLEQAGHSISWQVENDKQAQSVLRKHWPSVDLYGDVKDVGRSNLAPVDLICGGFPCTDLSIAGRRKGLAGEGSGLWWEFHRIIGELSPTWVLIENVPGLLSSNGGEDLAVILHGLEELRYGWSYRILDSQHFGVPQRRRRVFIVGHLGAPCPAEILLESEGVCGHPTQGTESGNKAAGPAGSGSQGDITYWDGGDISDTLDVSALVKGQMMPEKRRFPVVMAASGFGKFKERDTATTLRVEQRRQGDTDLVLSPSIKTYRYQNINTPLVEDTVSASMRAESATTDERSVPAYVVVQAFNFAPSGFMDGSSDLEAVETDTAAALDVTSLVKKTDRGTRVISNGTTAPRRLTPRECERLQGFPDDWTRWSDNGSELADGPRYRMMGNAVTVNVAEWLGARLKHKKK